MKPRPWCRGSGWTVVWISCAATILAVAGCTTTLRDEEAQPTTTSTLPNPPGIATFDGIAAGDCLTWPDDQPDSIKTVSCNDAHRFEVASVVDLSTLPGSEFGPDAPPPSQARIQQISIEQCQPAAQQYLGTHYDPTSRFTISLLWAGKVAWELGDERRVFCGLQLQGVDDARSRFTGRVADLDQSKVWPPGTCLGIDPAGSRGRTRRTPLPRCGRLPVDEEVAFRAVEKCRPRSVTRHGTDAARHLPTARRPTRLSDGAVDDGQCRAAQLHRRQVGIRGRRTAVLGEGVLLGLRGEPAWELLADVHRAGDLHTRE